MAKRKDNGNLNKSPEKGKADNGKSKRASQPCAGCPYRIGHEELCWPCWKKILGQPGGRADVAVEG